MDSEAGMARSKQAAAEHAAAQVEDGMLLGLGSGSTAELILPALGARIRSGLRITGIPTSRRTAELAAAQGIPLATLDDHPRLDLAIDGADEVEAGTLHLIKGRGGALLREKIVASASARLLIVVDESKLVEHLGEKTPVPVEVVPFGWRSTARRLQDLGGKPVPREAFVTDNGNYILDCAFGPIASPASLAAQIDGLTGVVEHGLFLGLTWQVIVGVNSAVRTLQLGPKGRRLS